LLAARRSLPRLRLVVGAALVFGAAELVLGVMPTYWTFALWLPIVGLCALTMITAANATIQLTVAPEMRGRVAALYMMIFMGGTPLGSPIIGWIGEVFGARWTLLGGALMTLAGTAVALVAYLRRERLVVRPRFAPRPRLTVTRRREAVTSQQIGEQEAAPDAAIAS
jgi:MFS family permease